MSISSNHGIPIVLYTKRDGKLIEWYVVKNPERWLKPTTSDQCGQNHGVYLWQSQVENEHYNFPSAICLERTALLSNN